MGFLALQSRVAQGNLTPTLPQVGSKAGAVLEARFQPPPRQTQHADFPHYAFSVNFIRKFMHPIGLAALSGPVMSNTVIVKQSQRFIEPGPTPSVPAEATAFS